METVLGRQPSRKETLWRNRPLKDFSLFKLNGEKDTLWNYTLFLTSLLENLTHFQRSCIFLKDGCSTISRLLNDREKYQK
jgi:hypothetical protein